MSSLLAQVIAQLKSAVDQLDELAVRATRAATDATEANAIYARVGTGSDHPQLRAAALQSRVGVDKARRLARLSSDAAQHVAAYLSAIAPGTAALPTHSGPPSGEELLADSDQRDLSRAMLRGFLTRPARKADDVQDHATTTANTIQHFASAFRDRYGPSGTHSSGTVTPTAPAAAPRPKIDAAEAAGNLAVLGILAGVAAHRITAVISERIARFRRRGR
ncbi:hypothetical protein [Micromonospora craniellae]|uniref:Uncharacterized protein n=1 Tax=Micromonospora craniellae TaxID=2294034 RepID=A0A372FQZ2_9ACTN|nr:hypothetical protein [Micromonospora craniellae]QOC93126.1 hypothetical protein ID554_05345 [Micromonospora craniellae]RFS40966.1 hypothetical protein D0Q02_30010 [Micromonospora craniellae]